MAKSYADVLTQMLTCVVKDAISAFPQLELEFEKDLTQLVTLIESRGIRCLLVDLPKALKHLDQCLDSGQYVPSHLPMMRQVSKTVVIPRLFRGLYLLIFDEGGRLRKDVSHEAVLFLRQLLGLAKRVRLQCPDDVVAATMRQFVEVDQSLPTPPARWCENNERDPVISASLAARLASELNKLEDGFCNEGIIPQIQTAIELITRDFSELREDAFNVQLSMLKEWTFDAYLSLRASVVGGKCQELVDLDPGIGRRLDRIFAFITSELGPYDPSEWRFKHGPGAIAAEAGSVNKYAWYSWPDSLDRVFPISEYGFYSYTSWLRSVAQVPQGTEASRLIAVAKTIDKPRLIAAEPSSYQWCQQNMRHYFYDRTAASRYLDRFIRFRDQSQNQRLCQSGSLTGELATLDLSEASDRVTCGVVEMAFRGNPALLDALAACRTRVVRVPNRGSFPMIRAELNDGGATDAPPNQSWIEDNYDESRSFLHPLNKFSTMGSAVTFPVQSLIFLGIILGVCTDGSPSQIEAMMGSVSVYGDDLIFPTHWRDRLQLVLEVLHFKVNAAKTFTGSNFRESCGVDSFQGTNVTPAYLSHLAAVGPESVVGMTETANHFYQRWMLNVSEFLRRTVEEQFHFPHVHPDSGVTGFKTRVLPTMHEVVGCSKRALRYRLRWNVGLQRFEAKVAMPSQAKQTKVRPGDDSQILQYFTEAPSPYDKWEAGWSEKPALRIKRGWVPLSDLTSQWAVGTNGHDLNWFWLAASLCHQCSSAVCRRG